MKLALAAVAVLAAAVPVAPIARAATPHTCLDGGDPQGASFHRTLTNTTRKRDLPTVISGSFIGEFSVAVASCPGVDYVLHLVSYDATSLAVQAVDPSPQTGHAAIAADGTSVAVSYPGDGESQTFLSRVTTGAGYVNPCVSSYVTIEIAGEVMTRSITRLDCDNGSAGETPYFITP
jgi:hypothetical protein